jgi:hypothetical protein
MNRGFECLGVSEIDINPKGRGGEVCAPLHCTGPLVGFHALPGSNRSFSATLGVLEGGQRPHASQDAAALRLITSWRACFCNS